MQIGDWGNVLIRHVREWKHRKHSPWACPFSGVEFRGAFHFKKIIFLQLLQICYERTHKATTRQSVWNGFYWQSKIGPPICAPFGTKSYIKKVKLWVYVTHQILQQSMCHKHVLYEGTKFGTNIVGEMCNNSATLFCAYLCKNEDTMNCVCCNIWCITCEPLCQQVSPKAHKF